MKVTAFKLARISGGFDQATVAMVVGVPENTISKFETGRALPTVGQARLLAEFLGKPTFELFPQGVKGIRA